MSRTVALGLLLTFVPILWAAPPGDTPATTEKLPEGALYRIGSPRMRHGNTAVICCAFSPDGKILASVGNDNLGKLWDVATGQLIHELKGHTGGVQGVAFTPDGKQVLTGSLDATLRLWDVATGKEVRVFTGHTAGVLPVAISPDGKHAVSEGQDGVVRLWDIATGKEVRTIPGHNSQGTTNLAFSPDSKTVATVGNDFAVRLWDVATGKELKAMAGHQDDVNSLEFSPDGKFLITASSDKSVRMWSVITGQQVRSFDGHTGMVSTTRYCPDGKTLFTGGTDKTLRLWDAGTGKEIRRFPGHRRTVSEVVVTPDGKIAATAGHDASLRLWDVATGQELPQSGGTAETAALSPDGKMIAAATGGTVRFFDAATGKPTAQPLTHTSAIHHVAFGSNKTLATLSEDHKVRIWDLATGKTSKTMTWSHQGGQPQQELPLHSLGFADDGKLVIAASFETGQTWEAATGKDLQRPFATDEARQGGPLRELILGRDGRFVATLHDRGDQATVRLWDAATSQELRHLTYPSNGTGKLSLSADGRSLIVAANQPAVRVWETATGLERARIAHANPNATAAAISEDGRLVAAADMAKTIHVYDVLQGKEVAKFPGHADETRELIFLPENKGLMSLGGDTTVIVWDLAAAVKKLADLPAKLEAAELQERWTDLGGDDGVKAMAAVWALVGAADQALPMFKERLGKTEVQDEVKKVPQWLKDLDADDFGQREKATRELERLGRLAEPAMREALGNKPPLEVKLRLERILEKLKLGGGSPQELRAIRAVEVLEKLNRAEAKKLLETLAEGPAEVIATREAKAALQRLRQK